MVGGSRAGAGAMVGLGVSELDYGGAGAENGVRGEGEAAIEADKLEV